MESKERKRYNSLILLLKNLERVAVAFSGGVDSTFLAKAAFDALGERALAITVDSEAYPPGSIEQTRSLAGRIGIRLVEIPVRVWDIPLFCDNPPDRCYHCKKTLFTVMKEKAVEMGAPTVVDGSNIDDDSDYRPGHRALAELGIRSPLKDLNFTKDEIRALSKKLGLPTWNMQSFACLASRFPYGSSITPALLDRTGKAEAFLRDYGIERYRVRNHGDLARIEVDEAGFSILAKKKVRKETVSYFKSLGYTYIALDLEGYRTGSMNEVLKMDGGSPETGDEPGA